MGITVSQNINIKEPEQTYPFLGQSRHDSRVILFHASSKGTVLIGDYKTEVGHYSDNWSMTFFDPYLGSLVISNE
jgi:hypothetical protein